MPLKYNLQKAYEPFKFLNWHVFRETIGRIPGLTILTQKPSDTEFVETIRLFEAFAHAIHKQDIRELCLSQQYETIHEFLGILVDTRPSSETNIGKLQAVKVLFETSDKDTLERWHKYERGEIALHNLPISATTIPIPEDRDTHTSTPSSSSTSSSSSESFSATAASHSLSSSSLSSSSLSSSSSSATTTNSLTFLPIPPYLTEARACMKTNNYNKIIEQLTPIIKHPPIRLTQNPRLHQNTLYLLAEALYRLGNHKEALVNFKHCVTIENAQAKIDGLPNNKGYAKRVENCENIIQMQAIQENIQKMQIS